MLSGYLMTLIMNDRYHYTINGISKYMTNRVLRIYPQYWVLLIITIIVLAYIPENQLNRINGALVLPKTVEDWLANIFILGLYPESIAPMPRLIPQAWALHVELIVYILIGLFFGRSKIIVTMWCAAGVLYHIAANIYGYPRYSPVYAASLAFSLGAILYHYKESIFAVFQPSRKLSISIWVLYLLYVFIVGTVDFGKTKLYFYLNFPLFFICLLVLLNLNASFKKYIKIDRYLGDYSYPVYLSHWFIGMLMASITGIGRSMPLFFISIPFVFIFSCVSIVLIDKKVERLRDIFK